MDLSIKGKGLDVGDALRDHVGANLDDAVGKYFAKALDAAVTISREAHLFRVDISVHPMRGIVVQGTGMEEDAYLAFDSALRAHRQAAPPLQAPAARPPQAARAATRRRSPAQQYIIARRGRSKRSCRSTVSLR